jgi:Fe-S cluster assembly iron-binding protein IscA
VLTLTPNATETIERILASPELPDGAGIRITPSTQAMDGASGGNLKLVVAEEPSDGDQVIDEHGARVFVQDSVADYLDDMLLDAGIVDEQIHFMLAAHPSDASL